MGVDMGGTGQFRVSPEHVAALRNELQAVSDEITSFMRDKAHEMAFPQQGADPVSADAVKAFRANASAAIQEAGKFAFNLGEVANSLDAAAKAYEANDANGQATLQNRS